MVGRQVNGQRISSYITVQRYVRVPDTEKCRTPRELRCRAMIHRAKRRKDRVVLSMRRYALHLALAGLAGALLAGCAASSLATKSPGDSKDRQTLPAAIERTTPPHYRRIPQGTYSTASSKPQKSVAKADTTKAAPQPASALQVPSLPNEPISVEQEEAGTEQKPEK